jgi:isochorismate synthase
VKPTHRHAEGVENDPWGLARTQLTEALRRANRGAPWGVDLPAPVLPVDGLLSLSPPACLWDAPTEGLSFSGQGAALRIRATGPRRWTSVRRQAGAVWKRLAWMRSEAPAPCFVGGFAFHQGEMVARWRDFGDACFTLPRWRYAKRGEWAWLSFACAGPAESERAVLDELTQVQRALTSSPADVTPRSQPASITQVSPRRWAGWVKAALTQIRRGRFDKLVLSRVARVRCEEAFDVLSPLASLTPAAAATRFAFLEDGSSFIGLTPERLASLQAGRVRAQALAGSSPAVPGAEEALLGDAKNRHEHALVLEHLRSRLKPLCEGVWTSAEPGVRRLPHIVHLETPVVASAVRGTHVLELIEALHPTPAVAGAPADEASAWLRRHEPEPRGWYAGPVGWFDAHGNGDFSVAIRSALVQGRHAWIPAGAGIVPGSDPSAEYEETALKQRTLLTALLPRSGRARRGLPS